MEVGLWVRCSSGRVVMLGVFQRQGSGYYVVIFEVRVGLCVEDVSLGRVMLGA